MRLVPVLCLTALAGVLPAQQETPPTPRGTEEQQERLDKFLRDKADAASRADGDWLRGDADPYRNARIRRDVRAPKPGLERQAGLQVGLRPSRIAPGQSGNLYVVLAMVKTAVIRAGAPIEARYDRQQGSVTLGDWSITPPQKGKLGTVFQGVEVYEDTAVLSIPVQIAADAAFGDHVVRIPLEVEITNGSSGKVRGVYTGVASGSVRVGRPLPVPRVANSAGADQSGSPVTAAGGSEPAGEGAAATDPGGRSEPPVPGIRGGEADGRVVDTPVPAAEDGSGMPWWAWFGVGFLAFLLVRPMLRSGRG